LYALSFGVVGNVHFFSAPWDHPVLGGRCSERVGRLRVGLVEVREHLVRRGRLEVGVEVDPAVGLVHVAVQALAIGAVGARVGHLDGVAALLQRGRGQGEEPVVVIGLQRMAVHHQLADGGLVEVQGERGRGIGEVEGDTHRPGEGRLAAELHVQRVREVGQARGAGGGGFARQVGIGLARCRRRRRRRRMRRCGSGRMAERKDGQGEAGKERDAEAERQGHGVGSQGRDARPGRVRRA